MFSQQHGGKLLEDEQDLAKKRARLKHFEDNPVKLRKPLADPDIFYRNYIDMQDEPKSLDRITLMLTGIYKFARHEHSYLHKLNSRGDPAGRPISS